MRSDRVLNSVLAWVSGLATIVAVIWVCSEAWHTLLHSGDVLAARGWATHLHVPNEASIFVARCLADAACNPLLFRVFGRTLPQWQLYLPLAPFTVWVVIRVIVRLGVKFQDPGQGRWATPHDLAAYLKDGKKQARRIGYMGMVGKQVLRLPENSRCAHTLIIGGTGAGKTTRYLNPNLLLDAQGGSSAVVFDLKYPDPRSGFLGTINYFRAWNRTVFAFTPFDPDSARLPLLDGVRTFQDAFDIAEIFRPSGQEEKNAFYRNNERQLLAGLILGVSLDGNASMRRVYELLSEGAEALKGYINQRPEVKQMLAALLGLKTDMLAGICTGLAGDLQLFMHPSLNRATSAGPGTRLDLRQLCKEPSFLYIGVPQEELQGGKGQVLLRLFKRLLDQAILEVAGENGGQLPVHLSVYLDEFPSFGALPNIAENLATMRSRRVAYHIALQNRAQGEAVYGRDEFRAMVNNNFAQMVIFPRSLRLEDAQFFSESFGEITVREESHSVNKEPGLSGIMGHSRQSRSYKEVARRLLTAEAMRTFEDGYAVVELIGTPPAIVRMPRLDEKDSPLRRVFMGIQSRYATPQLRQPGAKVSAGSVPSESGREFRVLNPGAGIVGAEIVSAGIVGNPLPVTGERGGGQTDGPAAPKPNPLAEEFREWLTELMQTGLPLDLEYDESGKPSLVNLKTADLPGLPTQLPAWTEKGWVQEWNETLTVTRVGLSRAERLLKALTEHHARLPALRWAADHAEGLEGHPRRAAGSPLLGRWADGAVWLPVEEAMQLVEADAVVWQDVQVGGRSLPLVEVRWAAASMPVTARSKGVSAPA